MTDSRPGRLRTPAEPASRPDAAARMLVLAFGLFALDVALAAVWLALTLTR